MASPSGCSLPRSAEATSRSSSSSGMPLATTTSVNSGSPLVRVPVLSRTTVSSAWAPSRASPPLIRIPCSAPRPVPTMIEVGVASPIAHGQAMISTATKFESASVKAGSGPNTSQTTNVTAASAMTTGTKTLLTLSASLCMGAFDPWASSTMREICASAVSLPTFVASKRKEPVCSPWRRLPRRPPAL